MTHMKLPNSLIKKGLFVSVAAFALCVAGAARAESLADAMIAAYKTSNLLEQNRATLRAADEDVAGAMAALRPVLAWSASYDYKATRPLTATDPNAASLGLVASMTLYDFGRSALAVDITKETVLATREALRAVEQDVLLETVSAYTAVKSAQQQVSINQNSVRVIGEELKAAQDRFEVGEVTKTDVALAEASLAAATAGLAAAQGSLEVARAEYKAATGHAARQLAALPPTPKLPKSLDAAQAIAVQNHPTIKQVQHNVAAADLGVSAAAAERLPVLAGTVGVARSDEDVTVRTGSLSLQQTIYSGGALPSAHRKAIASRDAARAGLRQTSVSLASGVAQAWAGIDVARAQINAYDEQIQAATVAYRGVKEEAKLGSRTTLDVLDAEQELLDARAARIEADAQLQVAIYSLLSAMGQLTVENLKLGIPTYDPAAYYNAVKDAPYTSVQGESLDRVLRSIAKE